MRQGRIRGMLATVGFVMATLGCGPGPAAGGPAPSAPPDGAVIAAASLKFDRTELRVPADRPFQLLFENRDSAPHNVTLLSPSGEPAYIGEVFSGVGARLYDIPAIPSGSYTFRCDVHPDMTGTVIATATAAVRANAARLVEVGSVDAPQPEPAPAPPDQPR